MSEQLEHPRMNDSDDNVEDLISDLRDVERIAGMPEVDIENSILRHLLNASRLVSKAKVLKKAGINIDSILSVAQEELDRAVRFGADDDRAQELQGEIFNLKQDSKNA